MGQIHCWNLKLVKIQKSTVLGVRATIYNKTPTLKAQGTAHKGGNGWKEEKSQRTRISSGRLSLLENQQINKPIKIKETKGSGDMKRAGG